MSFKGDAPSMLSLLDLATSLPLPSSDEPVMLIEVPDQYLSDERFELPGVEGLAIQRLLTLAQKDIKLSFRWTSLTARTVLTSPSVHALACVTLCLQNAEHTCPTDNSVSTLDFNQARSKLLAYRLRADLFSDRQVLLCVDNQRPSLPIDLYDPLTKRLRREDEFESFVDDLLYAQKGDGLTAERISRLRLPLTVILRELHENTDDHAKTDFDGSILKPNALRGLLIKRILEHRKMPKKGIASEATVPCLEFTIFDSGIGYYDSYRRQYLRGQARGEPVTAGEKHADTLRAHTLGSAVSIETEYGILLKCLERHSSNAIPDPRPGHRGMGLYETLRALKTMQGLFEVRTGRIHGYRSFLEGEYRIQLEPETSKERPGMPKPSLLDVKNRFITKPTQHEQVRGSVIRVVVPLE